MGDSHYLSEQDAHSTIHLLGQIACGNNDHAAQKRFLACGLADLIQADVWHCAQLSWSGEVTSPIPFFMVDGGWASDQQRVLMFQWHSHPGYKELIDARLIPLGRQGRPFTRSRTQIISASDWYGSEFYHDCRVPADLDDFLYSVYPIGQNRSGQLTFSNFGFYRACGKTPFGDRERSIVHLVSSEVDWLHRAGTDVPAREHVADLPPRLYQVMLMLLAGDSAKQVAYKLDISHYTVNEYVKTLHRRFGVSNRNELLAQFVSGDAVDRDSYI